MGNLIGFRSIMKLLIDKQMIQIQTASIDFTGPTSTHCDTVAGSIFTDGL